MPKPAHRRQRSHRLGLIGLAFVAFVALGLPDGLLGVGWPAIREGFFIPLDAIGLFLTALVVGYMVSSFSSGLLLQRLGVGLLLAISCLLTGGALIGYTLVPQWWMMVALGVIAGLGAGAIDAGLNTYVALHFGDGLMQWLHASWGVGITMGPLIMTYGLTTYQAWQYGYQAVGIFQLVLAVCFVLTLSWWVQRHASESHTRQKQRTAHKTPIRDSLRQPQVWLSVGLFILYAGAEASLGTWIYTLLTESRGVNEAMAGFLAGSYWFTFTVGRILAGLVAVRIGVHKLVIGGLNGALLGVVLLIWNPSKIANLVAVAVVGLAIAPIFPAMVSGTMRRVGEHHVGNTIGIQMAATGLGMALIPSLMGVLARGLSLEVIPVCLLVVYAALLGCYFLAVNTGVDQRGTADISAAM